MLYNNKFNAVLLMPGPPPPPPPPPANLFSQPPKNADLLRDIKNTPKLKKVDQNLINDKSAPKIAENPSNKIDTTKLESKKSATVKPIPIVSGNIQEELAKKFTACNKNNNTTQPTQSTQSNITPSTTTATSKEKPPIAPKPKLTQEKIDCTKEIKDNLKNHAQPPIATNQTQKLPPKPANNNQNKKENSWKIPTSIAIACLAAASAAFLTNKLLKNVIENRILLIASTIIAAVIVGAIFGLGSKITLDKISENRNSAKQIK